MTQGSKKPDQYRGLTRGSDAALAALGQERLAPGEVSERVRVRMRSEVMAWFMGLSAAKRGQILEREYRDVTNNHPG